MAGYIHKEYILHEKEYFLIELLFL